MVTGLKYKAIFVAECGFEPRFTHTQRYCKYTNDYNNTLTITVVV